MPTPGRYRHEMRPLQLDLILVGRSRAVRLTMSVTLEAKEQRIGPVGSQLSENVLKTAPYAEMAATRSSEQGLNGVTHAWSRGSLGLTTAGTGVVCSSGQPAVVGTSRSTTRNATYNTASPSSHVRCEYIVASPVMRCSSTRRARQASSAVSAMR